MPDSGTPLALTLIDQSTPSGSNNDVTCWLYRGVGPDTGAGDVTLTHDSNDNWGSVAWNSDVNLTINQLEEDVNDAPNNNLVFASAGAAGATAIALGTFKGGDGDTVSDGAGFTYFANTASGTNVNSDISFFVAHDIAGLTEAATFTWNASDDNAGMYYEFIESVGGGITIPVLMNHFRQQHRTH